MSFLKNQKQPREEQEQDPESREACLGRECARLHCEPVGGAPPPKPQPPACQGGPLQLRNSEQTVQRARRLFLNFLLQG